MRDYQLTITLPNGRTANAALADFDELLRHPTFALEVLKRLKEYAETVDETPYTLCNLRT